MTNARARTAVAITLSMLAVRASAEIAEGLVSYWPLDELIENGDSTFTSVDIVTGNDFTGINMAAEDVVPGQRGNALIFASQFMNYLYHISPAGEDTGLPVTEAPSWTVMLWVKATYPISGENDRRAFSVSSSTDDNPLVNIGTHNAGTDDTVDLYVRNAGITQVDHAHSTASGYDGEWRHLTLVDDAGLLALYIDGVLDYTNTYTRGSSPSDTTSIAAIVRQAGDNVGAYFSGTIDEVMVWERALSEAEIIEAKDTGIPTPVPVYPPVITTQPVGNLELVESDNYTMTVHATGSRPFTYQWRKDGTDLVGETAASLVLTNLQFSDAGLYSVEVANAAGNEASDDAELVINAGDIASGLVAHWPLDEVCGTKTPDIVSEYDMDLTNLTAADLVASPRGNAMAFDNARQTLLSRVHGPTDELPANKHESFTISMWVNVQGTGQTDLRVFSEASTATSDPLFNIGTHNTAADGTVDLFFRQSGWTTVNHIHSTQTAFDATWRHLVFVQRAGVRKVYVDGIEDALVIPDKEPGDWLANNTTIGGILRASASHWVTGQIDEVAIWNRGLSPGEIATVFTDGVPEVIVTRPPEISSFQVEVPRVETGGTTVLSWNGSKDAIFEIDQGIGDVTAQGECGTGSIEVTVTAETTYTLTATRGGQTETAQVTVSVRDGVAANWRLVDDFQTYPTGPIADASLWKNPEGLATVVARADGNQALGFDGGNDLNALPLGSMSLEPGGEQPGEGELVTLFFRVYRKAEDTANGAGINIGLTEKPVRFVGDFEQDVGPYMRIEDVGLSNATVRLGARDGFGAEYTYDAEAKPAATVYNIWIDVENLENLPSDTGDFFSVYVAEEGGARTQVFDTYLGDRNPAGSPELGAPKDVLSTLLVSAIDAAPTAGVNQGPQGVDMLFVDDIFLSRGNQYLTTVPVPASSFEDPMGGDAATVEEIRVEAGQPLITFTGTAGAAYGIMAWDTLTGAPVELDEVTATGGSDPYTDTRELQSEQFYGVEAK